MTWTTLPNGDKQLVILTGNSLTLPADWNPAANTVECHGNGCNSSRPPGAPAIGGNASGLGGGGGGFDSGTQKGAGAGGGAYAKEFNLGTPNETVNFHIGQPGCTDTWFISPATVKAAGSTGWKGGTTANSVGSVLHRGGNGPTLAMLQAGALDGGGGAGPDGPGGDAGTLGNPGASGGGLAGSGGVANDPGVGQGAGGGIVVTYTPS